MPIFPSLAGTAQDYSMERKHFKSRKIEYSEDALIHVLNTSDRRYDVYWATLALREIGTLKCIEPLKKLIFHSMQDVKCTSILTIAMIAGSDETPFYASALLDPKYKEKGYALWALLECGNSLGVAAVIAHLNKVLMRHKKKDIHDDELPSVVFLSRFASSNPEAKQAIDSWFRVRTPLPAYLIDSLTSNSDYLRTMIPTINRP